MICQIYYQNVIEWTSIGFLAVTISVINLSMQISVALYRLYKGMFDIKNKYNLFYLFVLGGPFIFAIMLSDFALIVVTGYLIDNQDEQMTTCSKLASMCYTVLPLSALALSLKVTLLLLEKKTITRIKKLKSLSYKLIYLLNIPSIALVVILG